MATSERVCDLWYLLLCALPLLVISSLAYRVFYNLYLHPLAKIPGPKLAAATYLYQTYFGLVGSSRYYIQITKMHEKYGPVVRITPDEVHLNDPEHFEVLNCVGTKYAKSIQFYGGFGIGYSTFTTGPIDLHRKRRAILDPFFSRRAVLALQSIVQSRADKLTSIMVAKFARNEAVDLHHAFRAISMDVITGYAFGQSYDLLEQDDFGRELFTMLRGIGPMLWVFQQWPALQRLALSMPVALSKWMSRPLKMVLNLQEHCLQQVLAVKADMDAGRKVGKPSLFEVLLTPGKDNPVPPTPDQIKDEAHSVLAAASDTTGNAMTVAAYHVVSNPKMYKALTDELREAFPDPGVTMDYLTLEKLPYLTGVIKEGLRLSFGVPGRLPRVVPESGATFNGYTLPAGSFVSMSSWDLHHNEAYFPDPKTFNPSRWLDPKEARRLDKAFIPFSKGSRGCVGQNLAYCELYLSLGTMFKRFENLKGNELTEKDLVYDDYFSSHHPLDATKFHVTNGGVKGE